MAIGPDSRRTASGRVVVVAVIETALGGAAVLVGLGPLLTPAAAHVKVFGLTAIALGLLAAVGGVALWSRAQASRRLGVLGAEATAVLGAMTAVLSLSGFAGCADTRAGIARCLPPATILVVGAVVFAFGVMAVAVVRRARPSTLSRRQDRRHQP